MRWGTQEQKEEELSEELLSSMKKEDGSSTKSKRQEDFVSPRTSSQMMSSAALTWCVLNGTTRYSYNVKLTPHQLNALILSLPRDTPVVLSVSEQSHGTIEKDLLNTDFLNQGK